MAGAAGFALAAMVRTDGRGALAGAVIAVAGAIVYLVWPRIGATVLVACGTAGIVLVGLALIMSGSVPWLLIAFWGASATLLAGLLHFTEQGPSAARLAAVTVGAVVALLVLSAFGLGLYVRMTWSEQERAVLESAQLAEDAPGLSGVVEPAAEPAPGGEWAIHWTYVGDEPEAAFDEIGRRLAARGWQVSRTPEGLVAEHTGYRIRVVLDETATQDSSPRGAESSQTVVPMSAYVAQSPLE
jgi:hypothetical protein